YDVDVIDGQHYFTMQFLSGGTLQQRLQQGPLPPAQAATLVRRVAEAGQHAHQRGIIHPDSQPGNDPLPEKPSRRAAEAQRSAEETRENQGETGTADGTKATPRPLSYSSDRCVSAAVPESFLFPKLTDFGLARLVEGGGPTATVEQLGTPGYMA